MHDIKCQMFYTITNTYLVDQSYICSAKLVHVAHLLAPVKTFPYIPLVSCTSLRHQHHALHNCTCSLVMCLLVMHQPSYAPLSHMPILSCTHTFIHPYSHAYLSMSLHSHVPSLHVQTFSCNPYIHSIMHLLSNVPSFSLTHFLMLPLFLGQTYLFYSLEVIIFLFG